MKLMETKMQDNYIEDSLQNSMSYSEYLNLVEELVNLNSTTGNDKSEALAQYTKLNHRRMLRWDKKIHIPEEQHNRIQQFKRNVTWLVITESWCGDAAHIVPVIHKVSELNDHISLRLVLRDDNDDLMNRFLTNGGRAIPKLIMIDDTTKEVLNTFGPRPSVATNMVQSYKETHGQLTPEFKEDLQRWYNKDKGQSVITDLIQLLS